MASPISLNSKILVLGAGIGGLSLALSLARRGARNIRIFERRTAIESLGAGLQLGPNATRALSELGLEEQLAAVSQRFDSGEMFDARSGKKLTELPLDAHACSRYGAHNYQLLRADLLQMLWGAVKESLGEQCLELGAEAVSLEPEERPSVVFADGRREEADLVIAADGVESKIRSLLFEDSESRYSGYYAWRGLLDAGKLAASDKIDTLSVWMDQGRHLIAYPLGDGRQINLVGVSEKPRWEYASAVVDADPAEWLAEYANWTSRPLKLIQQLDSCRRWSLRLCPQLPHWHNGAVGLLGDAAHPMLPSLAQGAGMAIEDAVCLASLVSEGGFSAEELFNTYSAGRQARVQRVQEASAWNLRFFHQKQSVLRATRNLGMRVGGKITPKIIGRRYDWLYKD